MQKRWHLTAISKILCRKLEIKQTNGCFFLGGGEGGIYPYMVTGGVAYLKTYDTILIIIILSAQSSSVETVNQGGL